MPATTRCGSPFPHPAADDARRCDKAAQNAIVPDLPEFEADLRVLRASRAPAAKAADVVDASTVM
jgi:hypothetical protein